MSVTIRELIEELKGLDPDLIVVVASDEEGNGYSPLDEAFSLGVYYDDGPLEGEFRSAGDDEDEEIDEDDEEDEELFTDVNANPAIVFWPTR